MEDVKISEKLDPEVSEYFKKNLRLIEDIAPSTAVLSAEMHEEQDDTEVNVSISCSEWKNSVKKKDSNPFIAVDLALGEMKEFILQKKDGIDLRQF